MWKSCEIRTMVIRWFPHEIQINKIKMKKLSEVYPDTSDLIEQLDTIVSYYNKKFNMNQGGCVAAAAIITNECEKYNIPYKLAAYVDQNVNTSDLASIIQSGEIKHLSVVIHGNEIDGVSPQDMSKEGWKKKIFINVKSDDLVSLYENGEWNDEYNDELNDDFIQEIEDLFWVMFGSSTKRNYDEV